MSTLEDLNSNSVDSDDCDYVPEGEVSEVSVDESEDESDAEKDEIDVKGKKRKVLNSEIQETKSERLDPDTKQRTEDIWKTFLEDVGTTSKKKKTVDQTTEQTTITNEKNVDSKSDLSTLISPLKNTVTTKIFEFAGESVTVTNKIKENIDRLETSESSKATTSDQQKVQLLPVAPKRHGGLGNLIGNIMNKKPKMTVLQKSLHDWNSFKEEEGLGEDLEKFNKGKGGFLEKQAFLQRSDVRQFELEKSVRLSSKTKRKIY